MIDSLQNICFWLCDSENKGKLQNIDQEPNPHKQKIIRELGLIEMTVNILYFLYEYNLIKIIIEEG